MKNLARLVISVACLAVCAVICFAQTVPADQTPAVPNETKSTVQGKVVQDPGGQGVRKVKVTLSGTSGGHAPVNHDAVTDEAGRFKIVGLEPGMYVLQFERPGYALNVKTNRDSTVSVIAGQDIEDLVLHLQIAGVISGKIVDLDGDPLRNVGVAATASRGATKKHFVPSANGTTNDLGEYRIPDLLPGKYVVQAAPQPNEVPSPTSNEKNNPKDRSIYVTTYYPGTLDEKQAAVVEVTAGGNAIANFGVLTSHAYRVSGSVQGIGPVPQGIGMNQLILVGTNGQTAEQNLAEGGEFELPNVLPGTYHAQLIVASFASGQPSIKMHAIRTPIEVNGSDIVGLQLEVDPGGDVSGKFRMDGDEKINWSELNVSLLAVPEGVETPEVRYFQPARVQEDGSFEMKDVPGGDCQLVISAQSDKFHDYYTKSVLLGGRDVADAGFAVNPGTVLDVVVSAKGAGIEGTVVDSNGKPTVGANVVTMPSSGKLGRPDAYQFAQTDASGHFALRGMNPGSFIVLAFDDMPGNYRAPEFAKQYDGKGEKVELEQGGKKTVMLKLIMDDDAKP